MKRKTATWVVGMASVLLAMGVAGCSLDALKGEQTPVEQEKSFAGQEISSVKVESHAIDVHLVAADSDQVQLLLKGTLSENAKDKDRENLLKASTSGSQLLVVATKPTSFMDSKGGTLQLEVRLPKKIYDAVQFDMHSSDLNVEAFQSKQLKVDTSSGNLKIEGFAGDELSADVHSGDLDLRKISGSTKLISHSGNVKLSMAEMTKDVSVETRSGDTVVLLPDAAAVRIEAVTKSADSVKLDFPLTSQKTDKDHFTGVTNNASSSAPLLKIDSSSGNFELGKAGK